MESMTRAEALAFLGLSMNATDAQIDAAIASEYRTWSARTNAPDFEARTEAQRRLNTLSQAEVTLLGQRQSRDASPNHGTASPTPVAPSTPPAHQTPPLAPPFVPPAPSVAPPAAPPMTAPPMTAPRATPSNTMATVALILSIVSILCLGPVAGVLAIVFGVLGLKKAGELGGRGRGTALTGVVLGVIGSVLWVVVGIVVVIAAGKASDSLSNALQNIGGTASPSTYEMKVEKCSYDGFEVTFSGTIKNTSSSSKNFLVVGSVTDSAGEDLGGMPIPVTSIAPGASKPWDFVIFGEPNGSITCKIDSVNNLMN